VLELGSELSLLVCLLITRHSPFVTVPPEEFPTPDESLMLLIAAGDSEAFRQFVERHQHLVIGLITRMIGSNDAEDLAQQVFLNVWKSAPRWRPDAKVTTWLLTIAKRLVFNEVRRRGRARLIPQSENVDNDQNEREYPDATPGPDRQVLEQELHRAIELAMALLPEKERLALVLRQYQGMPYEEIAGVLGVSLSAVKSLLFRARESMKVRLKPYLESGR
jgi:RNA polymerase sigma-70 factor (ECF subfamily)